MSLESYLAQHGIEHFSAMEVCPVGKLANGKGPALEPAPMPLWPNAIPTLRALEWLRGFTGPIEILSGYRDPAYNKAVGGAQKSVHRLFNAFDIRSDTHTPKQMRALLLKHPEAKKMGLGLYGTFLHVDTRGKIGLPAPARWSK